ncbi:cytosine permease [Clostridium sp. MSJ-11]|uniref:Cytosine permease n=1 Tax=Clostridium mobile TaxID=2841512 RepID=A0ABS6ED18_9CLOT|nr:cytosine permease [Clostridium mobile]MBU5482915.1 cytosine permease [Clostridium mobile]
MSTNSNSKKDHDFSLTAVPESDKKGFLSMLVVMLGFTFFSASMLTGGTLGTGLTLKKFLLAVLCGNLILGAYTGALAYISCETGLSTHLLSKYSFGEKGSYLVSFLLGTTQIGWFGVGVAMFAFPVAKVTGINLYLLVIISGILMTSSAYFGMKTLTIISTIAVPAIVVLGSYSAITATNAMGGFSAFLSYQPKETLAFTTALTMCVGSFISGGSLTPDFTRFAKTKKIGVSTTVLAFFIGNSLMFIFGAVGAAATGKSDISEVMFLQGLIIPAIIVLGLNIWTTNDNAIYSSGLGFSNITKLPKNKLVIFNGLLGTVFALWLYNNFVGWLTFLSSAIPAIGGIIIADFFIINKRKYSHIENTKFKNINWTAIISWAIGTLAAKYIPGITPLYGVIGGALSFVLINKATNTKYEEKKEKIAA